MLNSIRRYAVPKSISFDFINIFYHRTVIKHQILCNQAVFVPIPFCRSLYTSNIINAKAKKKQKDTKLKVVIRPIDAEDFIDLVELETSMKSKVIELQEDFMTQFVMKMDALAFENVKINIDNQIYMLNEIAVVNQDTPHLISVDMMYYPEHIEHASEAIRNHFSGLNPIVDGTLIKVPISNKTEEHKRLMEKKMKEKLYKAKENLTNFKFHEIKVLKMKEDDGLPKNLFHLICEQMDIFHKHYLSKMDDVFKSKSNELK